MNAMKAKDDIAGPGHNPADPQPMPNNEDPTINLVSIFFTSGIEKDWANNGFTLFLVKKKNGELTIIAPIITNINDGSHCPNKSKKPRTLAGFVMFDTVNPKPKITPLINEIILFILNCPNKWNSGYSC